MPKNRYQASQTSWPELDVDPNLIFGPRSQKKTLLKTIWRFAPQSYENVDMYRYLDLSMIYEIAASLGLTNISVYVYTTILVTRIFNVLERPHIWYILVNLNHN